MSELEVLRSLVDSLAERVYLQHELLQRRSFKGVNRMPFVVPLVTDAAPGTLGAAVRYTCFSCKKDSGLEPLRFLSNGGWSWIVKEGSDGREPLCPQCAKLSMTPPSTPAADPNPLNGERAWGGSETYAEDPMVDASYTKFETFDGTISVRCGVCQQTGIDGKKSDLDALGWRRMIHVDHNETRHDVICPWCMAKRGREAEEVAGKPKRGPIGQAADAILAECELIGEATIKPRAEEAPKPAAIVAFEKWIEADKEVNAAALAVRDASNRLDETRNIAADLARDLIPFFFPNVPYNTGAAGTFILSGRAYTLTKWRNTHPDDKPRLDIARVETITYVKDDPDEAEAHAAPSAS